MDIPLRNVPVFVYAFWHHLLKNGYKKRRCISTFFSEMTLLSLIFIISEAKSILTNFEPIQIY